MNWIRRWLSGGTAETASDARWADCPPARFLARGQLFTRGKAGWQCEYIYEVMRDGKTGEVRIVLPESFVAAWERSLGQRMTEPMRTALARQALSSVTAMTCLPCRTVVEEEAVRAMRGDGPEANCSSTGSR